MGKKPVEAHDGELGKGASIPIGEIGAAHQGIVRTEENDHGKNVEAEAFANDILEIEITPSSNKEDLDVVTPSVNGVNQPIVRGMRSFVKRKYVEALARCRFTRYAQRVADPSNPENIQMVENTSLVYPFTVYSDPHPNGREWLQAILRSA